MSTASIYSLADGLFTGLVITGTEEAVALNTPEGHAALEGAFDSQTQRVDLATGAVVARTPPAAPTALLDARARRRRDQLLTACDWRVVRAMETGESLSEAWETYRQALRDLTDQEGYPATIDWPSPPA